MRGWAAPFGPSRTVHGLPRKLGHSDYGNFLNGILLPPRREATLDIPRLLTGKYRNYTKQGHVYLEWLTEESIRRQGK